MESEVIQVFKESGPWRLIIGDVVRRWSWRSFQPPIGCDSDGSDPVVCSSAKVAAVYRPRRSRQSPRYRSIERYYPEFERTYGDRHVDVGCKWLTWKRNARFRRSGMETDETTGHEIAIRPNQR